MSTNDIDDEVTNYKATDHALTLAIHDKAHRACGMGLLALVAYIVTLFTPGWVRWISGLFVAGLFVAQLQIIGALFQLRRFRGGSPYDVVARNHVLFSSCAIAASAFALLGMWGRWPWVWLAIVFATLIDFVHAAGYDPKQSAG